MLQKFIFKKNIYPQFIEQLNIQLTQGKFVIYFDISDKKLDFYIIADKQLVTFSKSINNSLLTTTQPLPEKISNKEITTDFIKLIKNLKKEGSLVDSQHIIDNIHQNLNNFFIYYKLSSQEVKHIYQYVLEKWDFHFQNNPPPLIVNENELNKWID